MEVTSEILLPRREEVEEKVVKSTKFATLKKKNEISDNDDGADNDCNDGQDTQSCPR
jgi:hypothetical protein